MVIGIDLDGTIMSISFCNWNLRFSLPWWLFYLLIPIVLLSKPKQEVVEKMRLMQARGCKFIIVTRRPDQFFRFTKRLLMLHRVPFDGLYCVGFSKGVYERKFQVIKKEKVAMFVDSDKRIIEFLKRNSVQAVTSLDYLN